MVAHELSWQAIQTKVLPGSGFEASGSVTGMVVGVCAYSSTAAWAAATSAEPPLPAEEPSPEELPLLPAEFPHAASTTHTASTRSDRSARGRWEWTDMGLP